MYFIIYHHCTNKPTFFSCPNNLYSGQGAGGVKSKFFFQLQQCPRNQGGKRGELIFVPTKKITDELLEGKRKHLYYHLPSPPHHHQSPRWRN